MELGSKCSEGRNKAGAPACILKENGLQSMSFFGKRRDYAVIWVRVGRGRGLGLRWAREEKVFLAVLMLHKSSARNVPEEEATGRMPS